eukprot:3282058-Rhodomonas_salina.2
MQSPIESLPDNENVSAGHDTHADPPVSFRYVPALQRMHDPDPLTFVYDPTAHGTHADPPVSFRYVPALHAVHDPDPFTALYDPLSHERQADPPVSLRLHDSDPLVGLYDAAAHARQFAPSVGSLHMDALRAEFWGHGVLKLMASSRRKS